MSTEPPAVHPTWCTREAAELDQGSHIAAWVDLGDTTARVRARVRLHLYWPDTGMPDGAGGVEVELTEDGAMYDSWLTRQQAQALHDALGVMLQQAGTP